MLAALPENPKKTTPEYFVMPQSKFLDLINKNMKNDAEDNFDREVVYRRNSQNIDCIHFYNKKNHNKIKTVFYDYFDDKKIKSVDEFDPETGNKIRTINYTIFKSVTEFNIKTGKKLKTINFSIRDENKIVSIHEYHSIYERVSRISIFRPDGKSVSMVKEINPLTERVEQCINYKRNSGVVSSVSKYDFHNNKMVKTTCYYTNHEDSFKNFNSAPVSEFEKQKTAKLIDNLFAKNLSFSTLQI